MILFQVLLLVLIGITFAIPTEEKDEDKVIPVTEKQEEDDETSDSGKKLEPVELAKHKSYLKEFGDKESKFRTKGYRRKADDEGDDGYKHYDSFHKKNSDRHGYESHSAYGKSKKGENTGGAAGVKYDDKNDHQGAASRRIDHVISPWHGEDIASYLPHFDIEAIASKFDSHHGHHYHGHGDIEFLHHHHYHHDVEFDHPPDHDDHHHDHHHDVEFDHPPDHKDHHHDHHHDIEYDHPPNDKDHHYHHDIEYDHPSDDKDHHHDHHHHDVEFDHLPDHKDHHHDHHHDIEHDHTADDKDHQHDHHHDIEHDHHHDDVVFDHPPNYKDHYHHLHHDEDYYHHLPPDFKDYYDDHKDTSHIGYGLHSDQGDISPNVVSALPPPPPDGSIPPVPQPPGIPPVPPPSDMPPIPPPPGIPPVPPPPGIPPVPPPPGIPPVPPPPGMPAVPPPPNVPPVPPPPGMPPVLPPPGIAPVVPSSGMPFVPPTSDNLPEELDHPPPGFEISNSQAENLPSGFDSTERRDSSSASSQSNALNSAVNSNGKMSSSAGIYFGGPFNPDYKGIVRNNVGGEKNPNGGSGQNILSTKAQAIAQSSSSSAVTGKAEQTPLPNENASSPGNYKIYFGGLFNPDYQKRYYDLDSWDQSLKNLKSTQSTQNSTAQSQMINIDDFSNSTQENNGYIYTGGQLTPYDINNLIQESDSGNNLKDSYGNPYLPIDLRNYLPPLHQTDAQVGGVSQQSSQSDSDYRSHGAVVMENTSDSKVENAKNEWPYFGGPFNPDNIQVSAVVTTQDSATASGGSRNIIGLDQAVKSDSFSSIKSNYYLPPVNMNRNLGDVSKGSLKNGGKSPVNGPSGGKAMKREPGGMPRKSQSSSVEIIPALEIPARSEGGEQ